MTGAIHRKLTGAIHRKYKMDMSAAEVINTGGGVMIAQIPVTVRTLECRLGSWYTTDVPDDYYFVLAGPDGVGVYHTAISPLVDDDQFDTQEVYFDWSETAQYDLIEDGVELFTGYDFDGQWDIVCRTATEYYKCYENSEGLLD